MYGHPMNSGMGFMALRRAERRQAMRRRLVVWMVSAVASMGFLVLCVCLEGV